MRTVTGHQQVAGDALHQAIKITAGEPHRGGAPIAYNVELGNSGIVLHLPFHSGTLEDGIGLSGLTNETLLTIVIDRLEQFQDGAFACDENSTALHSLRLAMRDLRSRTAKRLCQGVEGKYEVHESRPRIYREAFTLFIEGEKFDIDTWVGPAIEAIKRMHEPLTAEEVQYLRDNLSGRGPWEAFLAELTPNTTPPAEKVAEEKKPRITKSDTHLVIQGLRGCGAKIELEKLQTWAGWNEVEAHVNRLYRNGEHALTPFELSVIKACPQTNAGKNGLKEFLSAVERM